jgi:hypothetical protein
MLKTFTTVIRTGKIILLSMLFMSQSANAQGIENIIVEKYYISDANDTLANIDGGILPIGSVTYRIFVDMLPGYKFQAAYGVPDHEMRIETTTLFFNNEDRGATSPTYTKVQASHNTVMLDSWLSVGAACAGQFGILKSMDDGIATVVNTDGVLMNADTSAGIPLTIQDGMVAGTPEPVTTVGITTEIAMFDAQNDGTNGPSFVTSNGSWASLYGSTGPDSVDNKVLIAQITTDGIFSFELNIQIGTPSGSAENYVARNPIGSEILLPALIYSSPINPIVKEINSNASPVLIAYPNPSAGKLSIRCPEIKDEKVSVSIYDLFGKKVFEKFTNAKNSIITDNMDISNLSKGGYIVEVTSDSGISRQRIIKN